MNIPTDIAVSRAYNGKISAIMNQAMQPGPNAKKMMIPVVAATETYVAKHHNIKEIRLESIMAHDTKAGVQLTLSMKLYDGFRMKLAVNTK